MSLLSFIIIIGSFMWHAMCNLGQFVTKLNKKIPDLPLIYLIINVIQIVVSFCRPLTMSTKYISSNIIDQVNLKEKNVQIPNTNVSDPLNGLHGKTHSVLGCKICPIMIRKSYMAIWEFISIVNKGSHNYVIYPVLGGTYHGIIHLSLECCGSG